MARKRLPQDEYSFRPARPGDFDTLVDMLGEMARFLGMEDDCLIARTDIDDREQRLTALRDAIFGKRKLLEAEVLVVRGRIEGLCTYYTTFSTYRGQPGLYIEDIFVSELYRG